MPAATSTVHAGTPSVAGALLPLLACAAGAAVRLLRMPPVVHQA
jgi:hypothetical protein